ncbi:MAG: ATP-binding protein [Polyangiaceae bacterium]
MEGKPIALLVVRFSMARELAAMARLARQILVVAAATALSLAVAILLAIHRIVVRPVRQLERAAMRLARGEGHQADSRARRVEDEVVRLADKFGEMAGAVRDREVRLSARNAELKLILDSVDQGFLTAQMDGTLLPERSAIVDRWLGEVSQDATLWSLAGLIEPGMEDVMSLGWQQLLDDFLPREVALDQLPKRLTRGRQHFNLAYHPEVIDDRLQHVVIVITDITAEIERQRSLLEQQEFAALVEQFVHDRRGFHTFWDEACALVARITDELPAGNPSLRRDLHTLKGNARFFRVNRVSSLCHDLESAMAERGTLELTTRERASLKDLWDSLRERMDPIMVGASSFLEMSREQYKNLLAAVRERQPPQDLERLVVGLRSESLHARLARLSEVLEIGCRRLGKSPPKVEIRGDDPRLPPQVWARFWAVFPHVLNNAADHGVEGDEERVRVGKALPSTVSMSGCLSDVEFVLEVRDDGRGIDWERLKQVMAERGLPHDSRKSLEQALFMEGVSLKREVSEISGRGVGLPAVLSVVLDMGGSIELDSEYGSGTSWRFRFPRRLLSEAESEDEAT